MIEQLASVLLPLALGDGRGEGLWAQGRNSSSPFAPKPSP
jgi:hypothetical protein